MWRLMAITDDPSYSPVRVSTAVPEASPNEEPLPKGRALALPYVIHLLQ